MEYKLYASKNELLQENNELFTNGTASLTELSSLLATAQSYERPTAYQYALKLVNGDDFLLILRGKLCDTLLFGAQSLVQYAANVIADCHFEISSVVGAATLVNAFCTAYQQRLGGEFSTVYADLESPFASTCVKASYKLANIRQALFAGGCFWCMAKPYYEYDGICKVLSGYAGGSEVNPTYDEVKRGLTHHKETVMLEYDNSVISFKQLLGIYFDTIDPFDEYGQFIDRGDNYTCAIFTDDEEEKSIILDYICRIEAQFERKVQVKVLGRQMFYKAEEYHQDYALKNPEAMEEELKSSGRLERKNVKK